MISKLLKYSTPNLLTSFTCYGYKTLSSKIFALRTPSNLIDSLFSEQSLNAETMAQYCYKWISFTSTDIGIRKMSQFIKALDRIDLKEASGEDIALYAALCCSGMDYNVNAWGNNYSKILVESKRIVNDEIQTLSNFALIYFYDFFHSYDNSLYMSKIADQMIKNMGEFSGKNYLSLVEILRKIQIYSKKQKQLITEMIHRLNILDEKQTTLSLSIPIYSNLRNLNYREKYRPQSSYSALLTSMLDRLIKNIDQMNENQVTRCFLILQAYDPLYKALFNNLIQSIDQDGQPNIPTELFIKFLNIVSHKKKLRSKDQAHFDKIYLFIERNFKVIRDSFQSDIIKIIQNQFFERSQLLKIQGLFEKQNFLQDNYLYIYECLAQNIHFTNYDSFIKKLPSLNVRKFTPNFFILCLTLKKMRDISPQIQQIEDKYKEYRKLIKQEIHLDYFWVWRVQKSMKLSSFIKFLQSFDDIFWTKVQTPKQGVYAKKEMVTLLYLANQKKRMNEYITGCKYNYQMVNQFIDLVSKNPEIAANRIDCLQILIKTGFNCLLNKESQKVNVRFKKLFNKLIVLIQNKEIHNRLHPNDAPKIINMAIKIIESYDKTQFCNSGYLFQGLIGMISHMKPSNKDCSQYIVFLNLLLQNSVSLNQVHLNILKEAKQYGVVSQNLIGLWDKKQVQNSRLSGLSDYIKLISNQTIDNQITIDQNNLSGLIYQITRSFSLNQIFINQRKSQLINVINKSQFNNLCECLFHFDSNAQLDEISHLNDIKIAIIEGLGNYGNLDKMTNLKLQRILSSINSHKAFPGSLKLLENLTSFIANNPNKFSFALHELLVYLHMKFNYRNENYIQKLLEIIREELRMNRFGRNEFLMKLLIHISSMEPKKSRMNLSGFIERRNKYILMSYFRNLFAEVDENVINSFKKFLESIKQSDIIIYEDIAKYVDVKSGGALKTELNAFKISANPNPNKSVEKLLGFIIGECQQNSISVSRIEECGLSILKINDQYVFFSANKVPASAKKLEVDYLETVFGEKIQLNQQKSNIHILHIHWSTPMSLVSQFSQILNLPNLVIDQKKIVEHFKEKQANSEPKQKQEEAE